MRKVALVFVTAVFVPSFLLACLAFRSLRDQQFLIERQQAASWQGLAGALVRQVNGTLTEQRREFNRRVDEVIAEQKTSDTTGQFDVFLRKNWPMAEVGFVVSLEGSGKVLSPSLFSDAEARTFRLENDRFVCTKEAVPVNWNAPQDVRLAKELERSEQLLKSSPEDRKKALAGDSTWTKAGLDSSSKSVYATKSGKVPAASKEPPKNSVEEAEFRQLIGDSSEGTLARFLQNQLKLLFWYRPVSDPQLVFGAQVNLARLMRELQPLFRVDENLTNEISVALLDDAERPRLKSNSKFRGDWKHPFVSAEIGEVLPHWQVGVYLNNPAKLGESAQTFRLALGSLIGVLLLAIGVGRWLNVS